MTGVWINLPWVTPFVYAGALKLGSVVVADVSGMSGFWMMLLVGTTIVGAAAALVTYCISFGALSWRRRRRRQPVDGPGAAPTAPQGREPLPR